jgi:kynurenine formamidase
MRIVRVIDLSHPIDSNTQVYPGDPVPNIEQHSTIDKDGFNLMSVQMGSQSGTHVDAPYHFDNGTPKIDELELTKFIGPALVIDCSWVRARESITLEKVKDQLPDVIPQMALFKTNWDRFYGTDEYFNNPYLDASLVELLIAKGVTCFGIDAINVDETPDDEHPGVGFPVHHLIAKAAGVISENLTNLSAINFENPLVSLLPMKFIGIDGAPVRAVALETK